MKLALKEKVIEQGDTIALLLTAIVAIILLSVGTLRNVVGILLLILCLLGLQAFHYLRRSSRIEGMQRKVKEISEIVYNLRDTAELLSKKGIVRLARRRNEIPIEEMHQAVKSAKKVFILSRYFTVFKNNSVQEVIHSCLRNGGKVQIIVYSPQGFHLDVKVDPDLTQKEARNRVRETLRRLKNFKDQLPTEEKKRFRYKTIKGYVIYTWMLGTQNKLFATFHLNYLTGDECPTIVCKPLSDLTNTIYSQLEQEFIELWKNYAEEDDQLISD